MQDLNKPWYEVWPEWATPSKRMQSNLPSEVKVRIVEYRASLHKNKITVLSDYANAHKKVKVLCNTCAHIWEASPNNLVRGRGCPCCANKLPVTQEEFEAKVKKKSPTLEVLGRYTLSKNKVSCRCIICNFTWDVLAYNLVSGISCLACKNSSQTHIYIMYEKASGLYKIGVSNNPPKRAAAIGSVELLFCKDVGKLAFQLEYILHRKYAQYQCNSTIARDGNTEFFSLQQKDIDNIKLLIQEYINDNI